MIEKAINRILALAVVEKFDFGGRIFASKSLHEIVPPEPAPMTVNTLTGLSDYLNENPDNLGLDTLVVHVIDPENVSLHSVLEPVHQSRKNYLAIHHEPLRFPFNKYQPVEDFIISMQTYFVPSDTVERIIRLAGNLVVEASVKHLDDGVSQEVTARTGITKVENVQVPNPVSLSPYRTFLEIDQPESNFVFRIKKDGSGAPTCALFAADGGTWKLEAKQSIKEWLGEKLPKVTILA